MTPFYELLKSRRSIRKYLQQPVEPDKIEIITRAALMSPASKRSNPWEFVVVQDAEMLQKLAECRMHGSQFLAAAPLAIVVIADTSKSDVWLEDASIAAIIMQLQAQDLGLGSCWIQVHDRQKDEQTFSADYIGNLLGIPGHYAVLCILSIGYSDENRRHYEDDKLAVDKIHYAKFKAHNT